MKQPFFKNGDAFPLFGLGTYLSKKNDVYNAVLEAIKIGYRHIDCASIYGNEAEIGEALQKSFADGWVKREDMFITSKLWNSDHTPECVEAAIKKTLHHLQLEQLDLYLMHWPIAFKAGKKNAQRAEDVVSLDQIPLEKTWAAMEQLYLKGLTLHIGVSNFSIKKLQQLMTHSNIAPEMNQVEIHPYFQQDELVDFCFENGVLVTAYSPLGSRHLMKSENGGLLAEETIKTLAKKHTCTETQIILAWNIQRGISVIPKSVHSGRICENIGALNIALDADDMETIRQLNRNLRLAKGAYAIFPNGYYTLENIWD